MPNLMLGKKLYAGKGPNIFDRLVSQWDQKTLRNAMVHAKDSIAEAIPLSFQFIDQVKHYNCQVFKSRHHYFIGGCQVDYKILPFNPLAQIGTLNDIKPRI